MSLIRRIQQLLSHRLRLDDPVFGILHGKRVHYRGDSYVFWEAERPFSYEDQQASVRIFTDEAGPCGKQRDLFTELCERYQTLREQITEPLAAEYEKIREEWQLDCRPLEAPHEIWKVARLFAIEINRDQQGNSDLVLDHEIDWEADHQLNVAIESWNIVEVMLEG